MSEKIRAAAAVVLARRDEPDAELFLVQRGPATRFFPGYWAFPGGVLDAGEDFGPAALRELDEETGLCLSLADLEPAGRLITPRFAPTRYDTQFYLARAPAGAAPRVEPGELADGRWLRPSEALARFERELFPLPPPVLAMLHAYRDHAPRAAAAKVRATDGRPHHERFAITFHPGIVAEPLETPTLPPATTTNCWLIGRESVLVVDPGPTDEAARAPLAWRLAEIEKRGARVEAVVLTHHHDDHVGAARWVAERTGAPVVAHPWTAEKLPRHVDRPVGDGHVFDLGRDPATGKDWRVRVLHVPGHTRGHLALRDERWGALVVGDCAAGVGTVIVDPPEGDMSAYFQSLERMIALDPPIVLPGHGPALPGRKALAQLLDHRRMREDKVLAALAKGPRTEDGMLDEVYDDVAPELRPLGARSMLAHLLKLEAEGRAARRGDAWSAT